MVQHALELKLAHECLRVALVFRHGDRPSRVEGCLCRKAPGGLGLDVPGKLGLLSQHPALREDVDDAGKRGPEGRRVRLQRGSSLVFATERPRRRRVHCPIRLCVISTAGPTTRLLHEQEKPSSTSWAVPISPIRLSLPLPAEFHVRSFTMRGEHITSSPEHDQRNQLHSDPEYSPDLRQITLLFPK